MLFFSIVTWLPGPISYLIYSLTANYFHALHLFSAKDSIATVLASFSFTMLGFLAAMITILFSLSGSRTFRKFNKNGYMSVFFMLYYSAIIGFMLTFIISLVLFSNEISIWIFRIGVMSAFNNIIQIGILTVTIVNLVKRAGDE